jgi:hypothetical protein
MISRFPRNKMVTVRKTSLAARIGIRRLVAFALDAAVGRSAIKRPTCEAVEGPDEQEHCHESNRDMKAAPHSSSE